jgi:hypothetical protein
MEIIAGTLSKPARLTVKSTRLRQPASNRYRLERFAEGV